MKTSYLTSILTTCVLALALVILGKSLFGQESSHSIKKQITVTGSAEMNIDPDQLELSITLHTARHELDKREEDLNSILKKHNISPEKLSFSQSDAWWDWWYYRNHNEINKTFKINLITSTSHKDILTYRKDVKKEAIKAAKTKATYLLEAIDEKIGGIISVDEITNDNTNNYNNWYWRNTLSNTVSNSNISMNANDSNSSDKIENLSKIKLRYEVKTVFEIQ